MKCPRECGLDAVMLPMHVAGNDFRELGRQLRAIRNLDGLVVTVPHKEAAPALADTVLPTAERVGAANALRRDADGRSVADMFDGIGFLGALRKTAVAASGASVLLLGAGGAGRAIAAALIGAGARRIAVVDPAPGRALELVRRFGETAAAGTLVVEASSSAAGSFDILVNVSPAGMRPDDPVPLGAEGLRGFRAVVDIVPSAAAPTRLARLAGSVGCRVANGQDMIDAQFPPLFDFLFASKPAH